MAQPERRPLMTLDRPKGQGDRVYDPTARYQTLNDAFDYDGRNIRKLVPHYTQLIDLGLQKGQNKKMRNAAMAALNFVRKHGEETGWVPKERKPRSEAEVAETERLKLARHERAIAQRQAWGKTEREVIQKVNDLKAAVPLKEGAENMEYRTYSRNEGPRVRNSRYYVSNGVLRGGRHVEFTTTNETVTFPLAVRSRRMLNSLATYEDPKLAIPKRKVLFRVGRWGKGRPVEQEAQLPMADVEIE